MNPDPDTPSARSAMSRASSDRTSPPAAAPDGAPSVVSLEQHLAQRGADLASILTAVRESTGIGPDDALLAVGSLVEGLGTTKSDLDLLLIAARPEPPASDVVTLVSGTSVVDMRILRRDALDDLVGRLRAWAELPWSVTHAVKFSIDDRTLLHRVLRGRLLEGDPAALAARAPDGEQLCRLKLHVARQASRTILVDMVGYRQSGDHRSLAFGAQELLGHAIDALVAAHGNSNPLLKWRARLLGSLPRDWEAALAMPPTGRTAAEAVWDLQRLPAAPDPAACALHASRIACFARAVFAWSERRLARPDLPADLPRRARAAAPGPTDEPPLPLVDYDVDVWPLPGGAMLGRLVEFEEPVHVTDDELAMLLLFDGVRGARAVERAVHGDDPDGRGAAARLVERLDAARMLVPRAEDPRRPAARGAG